jgi:cell division transport system permease protein
MSSLGGWLARHLQALISSIGHLARQPVATALTVAVMAMALALPQGLLTLVRNSLSATGGFSGAISLTVYLKPGSSEQKAEQLARSTRARSSVARVELITSAQALAEFRKSSGLGAALDALSENPLPPVLIVTPTERANDRASVENLRRALVASPDADLVQVDGDWVDRINAILAVMRMVLWIAAVLLGAAAIAIVGNTVRLEILNRRAEIEVTKLVGGTNAFVRRPFLYTGALYGLAAGLVASLVVSIAILALQKPVRELARTYGSDFALAGMRLDEVGWLCLSGLALGWLGALLATARHLARIEPRN